MLSLQGVTLGYTEENILLQNVDISLGEGDFVLLKGPSGSGKSTLLRLLSGLVLPREGRVLFKGEPLTSYDVTWLRRQVVYLQQVPVMLEASVRDNLQLPFQFKSARGTPMPSDGSLSDYLREFLLEGVSLETNAQELSVGQRQRLALIRALLLGPAVLLLDEPTASLDQESREAVEMRVAALNSERNVTIVMITHGDFIPPNENLRTLLLGSGLLKEITP